MCCLQLSCPDSQIVLFSVRMKACAELSNKYGPLSDCIYVDFTILVMIVFWGGFVRVNIMS